MPPIRFPNYGNGKNLSEVVPQAGSDAITLMAQLLALDPARR